MGNKWEISYDQALRLLAPRDNRYVLLDRALGSAIFAAAPITSAASFSLIDPKAEVLKLLRDFTGDAPARIRVSQGKRHYQLLEAAHALLVLLAFFETFKNELGEHHKKLELTDAEKVALAGGGTAEFPPRDLVDLLTDVGVELPSAFRSFEENLGKVRDKFQSLVIATLTFAEGLQCWEQIGRNLDFPGFRQRVVVAALEEYRRLYLRLAADLPEFALWMNSTEHASTKESVKTLTQAVTSQTQTLAVLHSLLASLADPSQQIHDVERRLGRRASAVLGMPIWARPVPGMTVPTVERGFVRPDYAWAIANGGSAPANEAWWAGQPEGNDLDEFLAAHFASPESVRNPVLVLGHPGAGKSLLASILAARLPPDVFTPLLIPLRHVPADAEIHQQIEVSLEAAVREHVSWGQFCRESATTKVLIFDGFDELLQTTGVAKSGYIERLARFQQDEWSDGASVIVVVTSRTLVMDRCRIPDGTLLVKIRDFNDRQVRDWVEVWNSTNERQERFLPLDAGAVLQQGELARQPLLLMLLSIYSSDDGAPTLGNEDLSGAELYRRLIDSFILRQVREKSSSEIPEAEIQRLQDLLRWDLSIAAFSMFNRGRQYTTEQELDADLNALSPLPEAAHCELGEPVSRAGQAIAAFFFVHVAQSGYYEKTPAPKRTYEFLHATFGEYLVAELLTKLLHDVDSDRRSHASRLFAGPLDNPTLQSLISHRCLTERYPILEFVRGLTAAGSLRRDPLSEAVGELLRRSRIQATPNRIEAYAPTPYDLVRRLAHYTANLVLLATAASPDGTPTEKLLPASDWTETVRLWRAGIDVDSQGSLFQNLVRLADGVHLGRRRRSFWTDPDSEMSEFGLPTYDSNVDYLAAELEGDVARAALLAVGTEVWLRPPRRVTQLQVETHARLMGLTSSRWPVPGLRHLTLWDEQNYSDIAAMVTQEPDRLTAPSAQMILRLLVDDGPLLPEWLVTRLVSVAMDACWGEKAREEGEPPSVPSSTLLFLVDRCPYLATIRHVEEAISHIAKSPSLLDIAIVHQSGSVGGRSGGGAEIAQRFDLKDHAFSEHSFDATNLSMDVIEAFVDVWMPVETVLGLFKTISRFGPVAWSQIEPQLMMRYLAKLEGVNAGQLTQLHDWIAPYVEYRGRYHDVDLASVLAKVDSLTNALSSPTTQQSGRSTNGPRTE